MRDASSRGGCRNKICGGIGVSFLVGCSIHTCAPFVVATASLRIVWVSNPSSSRLPCGLAVGLSAQGEGVTTPGVVLPSRLGPLLGIFGIDESLLLDANDTIPGLRPPLLLERLSILAIE